MHIVVHDFSGHPFQVQLSRELARRGHTVAHWYCTAYSSGKGAVEGRPGDPKSFTATGVPMASGFARYSARRRLGQEIRYGLEVSRRLIERRPEVVVMCNMPLVSLFIVARACARRGIPWVFWQQDIYSTAIGGAARARLRILGSAVAPIADRMERTIARRASQIVAISSSFLPILRRWGVSARVTVIRNWAPLDELPVVSRDCAWARDHDLVGRPVVLYAGTLGLKHNPQVILDLAGAMAVRVPHGRLVVVSEGRGRDWLAEQKRARDLPNLILLDYQPYPMFPEVLGSADVLLAILESDASAYSVPSKVLSYMCSGRPTVAAMAPDNDAAQMLKRSGGGLVVGAGAAAATAVAVLDLLDDEEARESMGRAARSFAEREFDIRAIAERFEVVLETAVQGGRRADVMCHP